MQAPIHFSSELSQVSSCSYLYAHSWKERKKSRASKPARKKRGKREIERDFLFFLASPAKTCLSVRPSFSGKMIEGVSIRTEQKERERERERYDETRRGKDEESLFRILQYRTECIRWMGWVGI